LPPRSPGQCNNTSEPRNEKLGIDLVDRLAKALTTTVADLLPTTAPPDTLGVLREQARRLFDSLAQAADRETHRSASSSARIRSMAAAGAQTPREKIFRPFISWMFQ